MSTWRRALSTLGHLLIVTLLGLPLVTPLLRWTAVPCTHDGHLHVHRIAAMRHAWENGIFLSRWVPDLAFGYGYPFFVYRESGPLYAILLPHLAGLPLAAASNLFYALTILAAGWFMFLWVRDVADAHAGLVSAVAYMAAPYLLIDTFVRGNAPESMALPLFPFLMWIGRRWVIKRSFWSFLLSVLGLALLSLSHNISTLLFVPSLLVYLLVIGRLKRIPWLPLLGRLILIFTLGLGLTFFYTGGALLEMDQVTLNQSTVTRNNDFHFNFASLGEILAPAAPVDPDLVNPPLPIRLGWAPFILALIGTTTPLWKRWISREQRWHVGLMVLAAAIYLFMALPISLPLWEKLPLISFVQFPWRLIGRAALPVAFLAGMPFMARPQEESGSNKNLVLNIATVAAIALLLLEAIPALYPRNCDEEAFPTIVDVHTYESATGLVGIDPEGSYFPRTVEERPQGSPLEADYVAGRTPQRFDLTVLPAGATAEVDYDGFGATTSVNTPEAFTARYLSFAFPGWTASVDGQPVPITPSDPEGLITFTVPPGEHIITVNWGSTPLRSALMLLGILALTGIVVALFAIGTTAVQSESSTPSSSINRALAVSLILVAVGLLAFKTVLVDNNLTPLRGTMSVPVAAPASLQAAELGFRGHNLSRDNVPAGGTFDIDLAWETTAPTLKTYQSNVWLADGQGRLWSNKETYRPRLFEDGPTTWEREPGQWAWDSREVQVLAGTPPGQYDIVLTLFDRDTLQPVTFTDESGTVIGPTAVIGQIDVLMPAEKPVFKPQYPAEIPLQDQGLTLLGFSQDRSQAAPGDPVLLTLFWERDDGPLTDKIDIQLLDENEAVVHAWRIPVINESFTASSWETGQRLRAQHLLRLPAGLDSGQYRLRLQDQAPLAALSITAPERQFELPGIYTAVEIPFGDEAQLVGYTTTQDGDRLVVDLAWQALQEITTAYNVFVHLVDDQGHIIAQSDAGPANWSRPTTGWVSGEFILDQHVLSLPPDSDPAQMRLRIGLYDPTDGRRLPTGDGGDAAEFSPEP